MCQRKSKIILSNIIIQFDYFYFQLDRLTKSIDIVQKEINSRYPYADTSPGNL